MLNKIFSFNVVNLFNRVQFEFSFLDGKKFTRILIKFGIGAFFCIPRFISFELFSDELSASSSINPTDTPL